MSRVRGGGGLLGMERGSGRERMRYRRGELRGVMNSIRGAIRRC